MKMNKDDYQVFNLFVKSCLLPWDKIKNLSYDDLRKLTVELIIRADCNQKCEYCYLTHKGLDLFPIEERTSKEQVLKNIKTFLEYCLDNNIYQMVWDLFAGDLFYDNLFFDIMELFYNYYQKIEEQCPEFKDKAKKDHGCINIPCNLSFIADDKKTQRVQNIIDDFKENLGIIIRFSWSTDGFYATSTREKKELTEEYFDKGFNFCKKNNYSFHPMISALNIDNWIKNYDWWVKKYQQYFYDDFINIQPPMLEVRDNNWTKDKIIKYIELLNHIIDTQFEICGKDLKTFSIYKFGNKHQFNNVGLSEYNVFMDPTRIFQSFDEKGSQNYMNCNLGKSLTINCYNLDIVPCHRTAYSFLRGGHFVVENNKIIGTEPYESFFAYMNLVLKNPSMGLRCNHCKYKIICMKQCAGACIENIGDYSIPCNTVCDLLENKYSFLIHKYEQMGVFNFILENLRECFPLTGGKLREFILELKNMEGLLINEDC